MGLDELKADFLEMLELSRRIGEYSEMILRHNNVLDKRNFDTVQSDGLGVVLGIHQERFDFLKDKWFGNQEEKDK